MYRIIIVLLSVILFRPAFTQVTASVEKEQQIKEMRVDINFNQKYKRQLRLLKRTYPMAIKAKELINEYESDLADISRRRKQKKYSKQAHQQLKDEFVYNIRDLYTSEGDLLMKLVHRETGMTVNEIIKNYRGSLQTGMYTGLAKIWGNDLNATYDPLGDDWITEIVIQDIESGRIKFDKTMKKMDKAAYKESMDEYHESRKESKARMKQVKKDNRAAKKAAARNN